VDPDYRFDPNRIIGLQVRALPGAKQVQLEKFRAWSDCAGDIETVFTRDRLLANIGLYWFTGAIGSSFSRYYCRSHSSWQIEESEIITVPTGYCEFPHEIVRPPRSVAERVFRDIRR